MAFTIEQLKGFKETLTIMNGKTSVSLKPEVLECMANLWRSRFCGFSNKIESLEETISELVKYKNISSPCGCLGSRDGWEWCPCELWSMMEIYKMDIAIHILETHSEKTTYQELLEISKLANPEQ